MAMQDPSSSHYTTLTDETYTYLYKVVLIGDSGVGKSTFIRSFIDRSFTNKMQPTIGVEFYSKKITLSNKKIVKCQIWDTAGQERYKSVSSSYYRGCDGALILFDITFRNSFQNVTTWIDEVNTYGREDVKIMVIGNKADLTENRVVSQNEATEFARSNHVAFVECSCKEIESTDQAFNSIVHAIYASRASHNLITIDPFANEPQSYESQSKAEKAKEIATKSAANAREAVAGLGNTIKLGMDKTRGKRSKNGPMEQGMDLGSGARGCC